jgi:hypothetical protein
MSPVATLAPDAAMALGIAATAMPFARTPEGEAERWLRVLRLHGESGIALQALGVSEGPVGGPGESHEREPSPPTGSSRPAGSSPPTESSRPAGSSPPTGSSLPAGSSPPTGSSLPTGSSSPAGSSPPTGAAERDAVARVTEQAVAIASGRGAGGVSTKDLLIAVMRFYGDDFDRVLRAHGTDCDEVLERLGAT